MRHHRLARAGLGLVLIAIVVVGGTPSAAADVDAGSSGDYGWWEIADRSFGPGVDCEYFFSGDFRSIKVRPPLMFARDRFDAQESQQMAWRFKIFHSDSGGGGPWDEVYKSSLQTSVSTDDAPAPFTARSWTVPDDPAFTDLFRVELTMIWYRPVNVQEGYVRRLLQHYRIRDVTQEGGYVLGEPVCTGTEP